MQITGKSDNVRESPICFGTAPLDSWALRKIQKSPAVNYKTFATSAPKWRPMNFSFQPISEAAVSSMVAEFYDSNNHLP